AITLLAEVLALGGYVSPAHADGIQLAAADVAVDDFFPAGGGIEKPLPVCFDQRNWERPVIGADIENDAVIAFGRGNARVGQRLGKSLKIGFVLNFIAGEKAVDLGAEDFVHGVFIGGFGSF